MHSTWSKASPTGVQGERASPLRAPRCGDAPGRFALPASQSASDIAGCSGQRARGRREELEGSPEQPGSGGTARDRDGTGDQRLVSAMFSPPPPPPSAQWLTGGKADARASVPGAPPATEEHIPLIQTHPAPKGYTCRKWQSRTNPGPCDFLTQPRHGRRQGASAGSGQPWGWLTAAEHHCWLLGRRRSRGSERQGQAWSRVCRDSAQGTPGWLRGRRPVACGHSRVYQ